MSKRQREALVALVVVVVLVAAFAFWQSRMRAQIDAASNKSGGNEGIDPLTGAPWQTDVAAGYTRS